MRESTVIVFAGVVLTALAGCASTEPTFAVPLDCQHQLSSQPARYLERPSSDEAGRRMSPDCLKRIHDSRVVPAPR